MNNYWYINQTKTSTLRDPPLKLFVAKIWGSRDQKVNVKDLQTIILVPTLGESGFFVS